MRLMSGATAPRSVSTGVISSLSAPSRTIVGRSSRRKRGEPLDVGLQRVAALGGRLGDLAGVLDRAADVRALARQRLEDRVGVARQVGDHLVLLGEDLQHLVDLLQRRVGAADDHAQVLAAAGDADAEVGEDDRQALAHRLAHDVVEQVDVDRLGVVLDRQQVLALARRPPRSARAPAAAPRRRARCSVSVHSTKRSPISDCGRTMQLASLAEVLVAGVLDVEHDGGLVVLGDVDRVDRADAHAGDLDVLAGDDEAGVLEDRADLVARRPRRPRQGDEHDTAAAAAISRATAATRLMGRGARGSGRSRGCRRR